MIPTSVDGVSEETHLNKTTRASFICGVVEGKLLSVVSSNIVRIKNISAILLMTTVVGILDRVMF